MQVWEADNFRSTSSKEAESKYRFEIEKILMQMPRVDRRLWLPSVDL